MLKRIVIISLFLLVPVGLLLISSPGIVMLNDALIGNGPIRMSDEVVETFTTSNQVFNVQVDMRLEEGGFMTPVNGAYYVYSSYPNGSAERTEFMTVHHDDPEPISRDSIQFISPEIGFAYDRSKLAVTQDAGNNWRIWDCWKSTNELILETYKLYCSIETVKIDSVGHGEMSLHSISNQPTDKPKLKTSDFGMTWAFE